MVSLLYYYPSLGDCVCSLIFCFGLYQCVGKICDAFSAAWEKKETEKVRKRKKFLSAFILWASHIVRAQWISMYWMDTYSLENVFRGQLH